jgi:hypothetical protein
MKKIILLFIFLFSLTTCSYVDETKIETDSRIEVDVFLQQSYNNVQLDKKFKNQEFDTEEIIEKINIPEINKSEEIVEQTLLDRDKSELLSFESISISDDEIIIKNELTADEIIIEETTSEDIEELINILFESNN